MRRLHDEGRLLGLTTAAIAGQAARGNHAEYVGDESPQSRADEDRQLQIALLNSVSTPTIAIGTSNTAGPTIAPEGRRIDAIRYSKDRNRAIEYLCTPGPLQRNRWIDGYDIRLDTQPWAAAIEIFWQKHIGSRFSKDLLVYPELNVHDGSRKPY